MTVYLKRALTARIIIPIRKHAPALHAQPTIAGSNIHQVFVVVGFGDALSDFQFLDRLFENLNTASTITGVNDNRLTGFG
jgi:hypothetical protein